LRVDAGQRDVRGNAGDEQQRERVEDPRTQLGNLQGVREGGKHRGFRLRISNCGSWGGRGSGSGVFDPRAAIRNPQLRQPTMAWPPAFSILAFADSENLAAVTLRAREISPSPRIFTMVS